MFVKTVTNSTYRYFHRCQFLTNRCSLSNTEFVFSTFYTHINIYTLPFEVALHHLLISKEFSWNTITKKLQSTCFRPLRVLNETKPRCSQPGPNQVDSNVLTIRLLMLHLVLAIDREMLNYSVIYIVSMSSSTNAISR